MTEPLIIPATKKDDKLLGNHRVKVFWLVLLGKKNPTLIVVA